MLSAHFYLWCIIYLDFIYITSSLLHFECAVLSNFLVYRLVIYACLVLKIYVVDPSLHVLSLINKLWLRTIILIWLYLLVNLINLRMLIIFNRWTYLILNRRLNLWILYPVLPFLKVVVLMVWWWYQWYKLIQRLNNLVWVAVVILSGMEITHKFLLNNSWMLRFIGWSNFYTLGDTSCFLMNL